jgi:hypothetical protein
VPSTFLPSQVDNGVADVATVVAWLYVAAVLFSFWWTGAGVWAYSASVFQLVHLTYYANAVLPPTLGNALLALKPVTLYFLPNIFAKILPEVVSRDNIPANIGTASGDFMFLRVCGYIYGVVLLIGLAMVLVKWATIPEINRIKPFRNILRAFLTRRFKAAFQTEALALICVNVTFYGVFQLRDLNVYQPVVGFSIFSAAAALLLCCLWPAGLIYQTWSFIS